MATCRFSINSIRVVQGQGRREGKLELSLRAGVHEDGEEEVTLTSVWSQVIGVVDGERPINAELARVEIADMDQAVWREVTLILIDNDARPLEDQRADAVGVRLTLSVSKFNPVSKRVVRLHLKERPFGATALIDVELVAAKLPNANDL